MRIHTSPSIQINEIDKSQYGLVMTGTKVYIQGFASKGEVYKPTDITSRTAFTLIFGEPETEAERYSYAAICEALNNQGKVCFCRLPYDNESFEKLVGFKYTVGAMKSKDKGLSNENSLWHEVYIADNEINDYCEISAAKEPILYNLADIDAFREDEAKVPADSFLIVDVTGSRYGKITEDYRKGKRRELVGIVPVVTTAANALYAQKMISVKDISAYNYESIDSNKTLFTLSGSQMTVDGNVISGLLESDLVRPINTRGLYWEQKNTFDLVTIYSLLGGTITLDDKIGHWYKTMTDFIEDYKLTGTYNLTTLAGMAYFYNNIKESDAPEFFDYNDVGELRLSCENAMNVIAGGDTKWYYKDIDGNEVELKTPPTVAEMSSYYVNDQLSGRPEFAALCSYINPASIKIAYDDDKKKYYVYASMMSATAMVQSEWHGKNGDDTLPMTMCLDANNYFATIQPSIDGNGFDPEHLKDIGVIVYKTYLDPAEGNKVSWEPVEAFCGSLYKDDKDPNTGVSKFIDLIINSQSQYINFFSNCFVSPTRKTQYLKDLDILIANPSYGASMGLYEDMTKKYISINKSIYDGMNKGFDKVTDINERDIDIVCDAGLANIASYMKAIYGDRGEYDLSITDDMGNSLLGLWKAKDSTNAAVKTWKTVEQKFDNFCKNVRKDCMFIADGLRPLVIQGQKKIIRETKPTNTLDKDVLPYLKTIAGLNTSYGAGYMNWFEQADDYTGDFFWCPPSIKAMGVYINTDVNYNYWDAPAGLNRGMIACTDVSFSPTASQADLIYDKCWNYAVRYPNDGTCLEGQKTFQCKPSALDRVNVRRLLLRLERAAYQVSRYFLYEGNTAYTRQRLVDALNPYFKACKTGGGCYDYKIVCDESNNTPTTIDQNELHVSIGIKPVKAIEYIMIDFIVASTGSSWAEVGL